MIKRLDNGNIELTIVLSWDKISKTQEKLVSEAVDQAELPGFRKGKAPRKAVEAKLDKSQILSQAISQELPKAYMAVVEEQKLKPVLYPQIQVQHGKEGEDWQFLAITCEAPEIVLPELPKIGEKIDMQKLLETSQVKLSDLIIESESNHRLNQLAENLTSLGTTVEKYLESKKMTVEDLKAKTATEAKKDLQTEFVLQRLQVELKTKTRQETLDRVTNTV